MSCTQCGAEINDEAVICPKCGCQVQAAGGDGEHSFVVTYLLSWFLGMFGAHRFYTGYIGIGIAQLLTLGGCGIWALVDFICLSFNKYKDKDGKELVDYKQWLGMLGFALTILGFIIRVIITIATSASSSY